MRHSALLGLLLCNVLWSATYAISKRLLDHGYQPMEVAFLRFFAAGIPLLVYGLAVRAPKHSRHSLLGAWARGLRLFDLRLVVVGALTFFMSPLCQLTGLEYSRAIDGSLMIATEPLATIAAACVMLGERLGLAQLGSLVLAVTGACVLSDVTWQKLIAFTDARLVGNSIFALSMVSEAAYSAVAKPVLDRRSPVLFLTVSLWVGIALMFAFNLVHDGPARLSGLVPLFRRGDWSDWASLLYLGWGCTLFAYLYWMSVLRDVSLSVMALTLYVQPVLGVAWGCLIVHESITISTLTGGALIMTAVWLGSRPRRQAAD